MAYDFYVAIEATKQGKIASEEIKTGPYKDKILGLAFDYEFWSPYDAATGHVSGKRMHKPMTFTKEWGSTTPKLFAGEGREVGCAHGGAR